MTLEPTTGSSAFTCDARGDGRQGARASTPPRWRSQALDVARDGGVTGLDDDITTPPTGSSAHQAADGSFVDQGTANSNSTGLAACALAPVGRTGAAGNAAAWLQNRQVPHAGRRQHRARPASVGAVAFDAAA